MDEILEVEKTQKAVDYPQYIIASGENKNLLSYSDLYLPIYFTS